jgi:hypothetical protein
MLEAQKQNKPSALMAMRRQHSLDTLAEENINQMEELDIGDNTDNVGE